MSGAADVIEIRGARTAGLIAEFDRLLILTRVVERHREGKQAGAELKRDLARAQERLAKARAGGLWERLLPGSGEPIAGPFAADVLAAAVFPHARPSAAHTLQALQPGTPGPAPTQALLHELLMLGAEEEIALHAALSPAQPLVASHLIRIDGSGPMRQIHPGARLLRQVLGPESFGALPTGIRLIDTGRTAVPDLLVPEETQRRLDEVAALARHLDRRAAAGEPVPGGPAALFVGAPGTGKSLAVRHVARALSKLLFQLDLGAVVSKWVGETERNLSRVFEQMSGTEGCILIDEADALLGKRVSVKEGRDHYVNITVSHLLTLLENHRGPVFLTSNLRANLDDAYTRRFASVVEFKRPDAELRRAMWRTVLAQSEVAGALADLAATVELSAAEISNAHLLAEALADGGPIDARHLARAVLREKTKVTQTFSKADLRALQDELE